MNNVKATNHFKKLMDDVFNTQKSTNIYALKVLKIVWGIFFKNVIMI